MAEEDVTASFQFKPECVTAQWKEQKHDLSIYMWS